MALGKFITSLTPWGFAMVMSCGMLYLIFSIVHPKGRIRLISDNHLSGLPEMHATLTSIKESNMRQEKILGDVSEKISNVQADMGYVKGRLNGKG